MVKGIANAETAEDRDAWLPLLTGAPISLTYAGGLLVLSGDIARGVGIGNEERETSPGDGGGLLLGSTVVRAWCLAVSVVFLAVDAASRVVDRDIDVGTASQDFCPLAELVLVYNGRGRGLGDEVAALIIAMATSDGDGRGILADSCTTLSTGDSVLLAGDAVSRAGVAESVSISSDCSRLCCRRSSAALASACFFSKASSSKSDLGLALCVAPESGLAFFLLLFFSLLFSGFVGGVIIVTGLSSNATLLADFDDRLRLFFSLEDDLDELDGSLEDGFRPCCGIFVSARASIRLFAGLSRGASAKSRVLTSGDGSLSRGPAGMILFAALLISASGDLSHRLPSLLDEPLALSRRSEPVCLAFGLPDPEDLAASDSSGLTSVRTLPRGPTLADNLASAPDPGALPL